MTKDSQPLRALLTVAKNIEYFQQGCLEYRLQKAQKELKTALFLVWQKSREL